MNTPGYNSFSNAFQVIALSTLDHVVKQFISYNTGDQAAPDKFESASASCDGYNVVGARVSMGIATNPYMAPSAVDHLS